MADQSSLEHQILSIEDLPTVPLVLSGISSRFIQENRIILIEYKNNVLKIAIENPEDYDTIDALKVALSADVVVFTADKQMVDEYLKRFYEQESQNINRIIEDMGDRGVEFLRDEEEEDVGHLKDLAAEAPIIKLVNMLITGAIESRASDIHIESFEDEIKVRYRIDGVLHHIESIPRKLQAAIISRIKIMAKLNIAEKRLPQDGRIKLRVGESEIDLRVSTIPVLYGESIVMRILRKEGIVIDLQATRIRRGNAFDLQYANPKTERHRSCYRPDGKRKDNDSVWCARQDQHSRQQDHYRRRPD